MECYHKVLIQPSKKKKHHTDFYKKEKGWVIFFIISALFIIATLEISFQIFNTLTPGKLEVLQSNVRSNMLEIITTLPPIPHPSGGLTGDFQASSWSVSKHKYTRVWAA